MGSAGGFCFRYKGGLLPSPSPISLIFVSRVVQRAFLKYEYSRMSLQDEGGEDVEDDDHGKQVEMKNPSILGARRQFKPRLRCATG